ncbi:MAG TPA: ABC transporter ATP-binding protein [Chitinophagaceae bacterium]|nr:ABC transporter ATP-binding protein [Chitinophagaceae bacterium]HQV85327.1 ABC transporter ATP-binding protein [Chitinophagaceae bacterium]HQX71949.1 ABC transporter ATP-binding protein [Chitinophagaceae bacterium]HQZ72864.1 ABC transporter ATP-binding protein [Chitinophagaceae bacterium]
MKVYKKLLAYARPYRWFVIPFFAFTILAVIFSVFQFALIIPLLNVLFDNNSGKEILSPPTFSVSANFFKDIFYYQVYRLKAVNPVYALYFITFVIVCAVLLANLFRYLAQRTLIKARTLLVKRIREALFEKINHLHMGFFTKEHKGDLISRMNSDVFEIEGVAANSLEVLFKEPSLIIGYFVALFAISTQLTLFTLIIIPISALGIATVQKRLRRDAKDAQASIGRLLTIMDETLTGMRIIRAFNATGFTLKKFSKENDFYRNASLQGFKRREMAPAFSEAAGVIVVAGILLYGGSLILQNGQTAAGIQASEFIAFIAIFSQVLRPAKAMVVAGANIQRGRAAGERILEIIDKPIEVKDKDDAALLNEFNYAIEFKNVDFSYNDMPVLKNVSFTISKGKTVALVGVSGVGKSTIADLIPRFYDVKNGAVLVDGIDVRDYKMESLRSHMSFVTQETFLFNDTIFNNIAIGKPDATEEEVMEAARIANAHDFIRQTENGYQTSIGDRGIRLSGGQRQRLCIARAVFKNPSILILDEATSALDTESERIVQDALGKLMKGRTTLVIAHRLSTIKEADEIIVLHEGQIIERGHHNELVEIEEGVYKKLTRMQQIA